FAHTMIGSSATVALRGSLNSTEPFFLKLKTPEAEIGFHFRGISPLEPLEAGAHEVWQWQTAPELTADPPPKYLRRLSLPPRESFLPTGAIDVSFKGPQAGPVVVFHKNALQDPKHGALLGVLNVFDHEAQDLSITFPSHTMLKGCS